MSRYNTIIPNDVVNGRGVCVSLFVQGCPHHCKGCFNKETWDFDDGIPYTQKTKFQILKLINANGIERNFSVLGGEPLAPQNLTMTMDIIHTVRKVYPKIKIFLWTGYTYEELAKSNFCLNTILKDIDVLIDGPFIQEKKDLSLVLRGSSNQHIWAKKEGQWIIKE